MIETLLRLSVPTTTEYSFLPYGDGVYFSKLTKDVLGYGPYYSQWTSSTINGDRLLVGHVAVFTGEFVNAYAEKDTLVLCQANEKSWFFDDDEQILYVNFDFGGTPETRDPIIGIINGYSRNDVQYINDIKYDPRLLSTSKTTQSVDPWNVGKMSFEDMTVSIANGDGEQDPLLTSPVPGSYGSVVLYDTETEDELYVNTGKVSKETSTTDKISLKLLDIRRAENTLIPNTFITSDEFPHVNSKWENKLVVDGYGGVFGLQAYPINEDESGNPDITFKYAQFSNGAYLVVYTKIDDEWVVATPTSTDPDNGMFTLARADAIPSGKTSAYETYIDVTLRVAPGSGSNYAYEVFSDINDRYLGVTYDNSNYDITEIEAEGNIIVDIVMDKQKNVYDWFGEMQTTANVQFVYLLNGEGKRTIRSDDRKYSIAKSIKYSDIKDSNILVERDFTEYASSIRRDQTKDERQGTYLYPVSSDFYKDSAIKAYGYPKELVIDAGRPFRGDSIKSYMSLSFSEVRAEMTIKIDVGTLSDLDLSIYDWVSVDTSRPEEIRRIKQPDQYNLGPTGETSTLDPTGSDVYNIGPPKKVVVSEAREYLGVFTGMVISLSYNPENNDYTIKLREVPDEYL